MRMLYIIPLFYSASPRLRMPCSSCSYRHYRRRSGWLSRCSALGHATDCGSAVGGAATPVVRRKGT